MKQNLGIIDRLSRIFLGTALVSLGIINHSWLGALGAIPLLTALVGFCPLYCPFGYSTKEAAKSRACGCGDGKCNRP